MKGRIAKDGTLYLERAGKEKAQICPHHQGDEWGAGRCGDWCPLFGEPVDIRPIEWFDGGLVKTGPEKWKLALCREKLVINGLADERKGGE